MFRASGGTENCRGRLPGMKEAPRTAAWMLLSTCPGTAECQPVVPCSTCARSCKEIEYSKLQCCVQHVPRTSVSRLFDRVA